MPKEEMRESLRPRIDAARIELAPYTPDELVQRAGVVFREGGLDFSLLGTPYRIDLPDLVAYFADGSICPEELQILFLDYLVHGDGSPVTGQWIGFQELPDGMFYRRAFQGYSGDQLIRDFADDINAFRDASRDLNGIPLEMGDAAFAFKVLPRISLAVVWWAGDDEFPANATVLFDSAASRYLPTDGLAIVGRMLCRKLAKLAGAS